MDCLKEFFERLKILTILIVIVTPLIVIPAEAGNQGNKQDLASGKAVTPAMSRALPWVPASAGMTEKGKKITRLYTILINSEGRNHDYAYL